MSDPGSAPPPLDDDARDTARLKAVLLLCATIAFVVSPLFTSPFTGFNPDQLPNPIEQPPVQPAGYAFSIWGVIYIWLLVSAGFGLVKRDVDPGWDRPRWPLFVSIAIGASWIAVALTAPVMATILIWVMLAGAVIAALRLPRHDARWYALPIGLYAGWLTAASCVALATVAMGHNLASPMLASWLGLLLAFGLSLWLTLKIRVMTYPLAVAWALIGVVVANITTTPVFAIAAGLGALPLLWLSLRLSRA